MNSNQLTIVIPTRDRPDFLEKCLRSVYECQTGIPTVIVSDNSTTDQPAIRVFQSKYGFDYVRQSGALNQTAHLNLCLGLASTPWTLILHDDDELYPDCLEKVETFLAGCKQIGIVVAGIQHIDEQGGILGKWIPKTDSVFRREDGLLRLGLDWGAAPPGTIYSVAAGRQIGGFVDVNGAAADYTFALRLAHSFGVAFFPYLVGRYRNGAQQKTDFSTPEKAEAWLDYSTRMAQLVRSVGCSDEVSNQLIDYMTWSVVLEIAPQCLRSNRSFAFGLCRKGLRASPHRGTWQNRVRKAYPFLFWRPQWLAWLLFSTGRAILPAPLRRWIKLLWRKSNLWPPVGWVRFGSLRRVTPISRIFGFDRGQCIDRYYIENFLARNAKDIRGCVLEIGDNTYTRRFGGELVTESQVLHVQEGNPRATIVADLTSSNPIASDSFDCVILTQTLQFIYDTRAAIRTLYRILKPGGILLATFAGISQISRYDRERWGDYWRFTTLSARRLFEEAFPTTHIKVEAYGNVLAAGAFLQGLAAEDLRREELDHRDPDYEVLITVRAVKSKESL